LAHFRIIFAFREKGKNRFRFNYKIELGLKSPIKVRVLESNLNCCYVNNIKQQPARIYYSVKARVVGVDLDPICIGSGFNGGCGSGSRSYRQRSKLRKNTKSSSLQVFNLTVRSPLLCIDCVFFNGSPWPQLQRHLLGSSTYCT
jgi:hypothetical protein